ncbi:MAG: hypothetical protein P8189_28180 [Anaerolineae bacterium]|jgi:hypothetical protein
MTVNSETRTKRRGRPRTRFQPDVRLTVRFCPGRDDDLLAWLDDLPERERAACIRQMLRRSLNGNVPGQEARGRQ